MSLVAVPTASEGLIEAEYALLANLLYDNNGIDAVADRLRVEDFASADYGTAFGLLLSEHAQGRPASALTLWPMACELPSFAGPQGKHHWMSMASSASLLSRPLDGAKLIAREARKRRLAEGLREGAAMAADPRISVEEVADCADEALTAALSPVVSSRSMTASTAMLRLAQDMDKPTRALFCKRVEPFDKLTRGIRPSQFILLAGRPGMGKTAAALSIATGYALNGHGTLYISLEMGASELSARQVADLSFDAKRQLSLDEILAERPPQHVIDRTIEYANRLAEFPFQIEDASSLSVGRLAMLVRRYKRKMAAKGHTLSVVVVDYLQLLRPDAKHQSRYEAISEISQSLKAIAKENDVALIALAQLSREVEKRPDKRPQLADLKDSGQLEQDADIVMFLLRDEYYVRKAEPARNDPGHPEWQRALADCENKLDFICAKHRQGQEGAIAGQFFTKFQAVR